MTDINLLPIEQRKKEKGEEKKKAFEKARLKIELARPIKEEKTPRLLRRSFLSEVSQGLKNIWQKIRSPKLTKISKPSKTPSPSYPSRPSIPAKHFNDIQVKEKKKFFYPPLPAKDKIKDKVEVKEQVRGRDIGEKQMSEQLAQVKIPSRPKETKLDINLVPGKIKGLITTKQKVKVLLIVVVICFLISGLTYLGVKQVISSHQAEAEKVDLETQELVEKINNLKTVNQEVNDFVVLLREAKQLVNQHSFWSQVFKFLEEHTLKQVAYNSLEVNAQDISVSLTAYTKDYQTLAQQLLYFQSLEEIVNIELSGVQPEKSKEKESEEGAGEEELVTFNLTLKLKPEVLYK